MTDRGQGSSTSRASTRWTRDAASMGREGKPLLDFNSNYRV